LRIVVVAAALVVAVGRMPWTSQLLRLVIVAVDGSWLLDVSTTHPLAAMWHAWAGGPALQELLAERPLPTTTLY